MPRPKSQEIRRCEELAAELGVSAKALWNSGITQRAMDESARQILINRLKKVNQPHGEAMLVGHGEIEIVETEETLTLTIRKQPQREKPLRVDENADVIAVRRASGM